VDFVVGEVLVEIKATSSLEALDVSQTLSYLKASGYQVVLLLNFGTAKLGIKRLISDH
jgi:GxxExxY protein